VLTIGAYSPPFAPRTGQKVSETYLSRNEGIPEEGYTFLNVIFAALIEILCLYRLFSSLLGRGWDPLSEPIRALLHSANI
jgi:hypothetical protein